MGNGWIQNQLRDAAGAFFGNDYLRDYTHASKAFTTNTYQYSPKFKYLFHCYFNINQNVYDLDKSVPGNSQNFGILVREVKLPSYTFQTTQLNQYNRKRIVQTKIKYDPVSFTFFDDNSNTMNKMWAAYYTYYYNDGAIPKVSIFGNARGGPGVDLSKAITAAGDVRGLSGAGSTTSPPPTVANYTKRNIYEPNLGGQMYWGYDSSNASNDEKEPFFTDITIFGFYMKNFISYTLINPIITNFAHDTYNYDEGTGVMKNTMSIDYETVVYNEGKMDGNKPGNLVPGFGDEAVYDRKLSPIATPGSNSNVLGQGGLVDSVGGALGDFKTNPLGAIKTLGTAYTTFKNTDIKQSLKQELKNSFMNNLRQKPNDTRNLTFKFDAAGSAVGDSMAAGAPTTGTQPGTTMDPNGGPMQGTGIQNGAKGQPTLSILGNQLRQAASGIVNAATQTVTGVTDTFRNAAERAAGKQSNSGGTTNIPPPGG